MFIRTERSVRDFITFYPIVSLLLLINLFMWLFINVLNLPISEQLYYTLVGHNLSIQMSGEYWRLFTPIFLHANIGHVVFNSFMLILFGPALERMIGKGLFLFVYLLAGIGGNLGTYIVEPSSMIPHLGASGAIYGLFGVYIYMSFFRKQLIAPSDAQIVRIIFIIGLVLTFIRPNINVPAHIFGFITGFALGPLVLKNAVFFVRPMSRTKKYTGDVGFDPNRWQKRRPVTHFIKKYFIWIIIVIIAIIGLLSSLL